MSTKCHFLKREVTFLGHVVSSDPEKVKSVTTWSVTLNVKELQSCLLYSSWFSKWKWVLKVDHQQTMRLSPPTRRNGFCGGYGDEQTHFRFFEQYWSNNGPDGVRSWELVRGHVTPVVLYCLMVRTMCLLTCCVPWGKLSYFVARYTKFLATRNVYGRPLQGRQRKGSLCESCPRLGS